MVYARRKYGRKRTKRSFKRKSYRKRGKRTFHRRRRAPINGMPVSKIVTLRYCESIDITGPTGTVGYYVWRANSIYDPNLTGTGHQPQRSDMWQNIYSHYEVIKSRCRCAFLPQKEAAQRPLLCGVMIDDDATILAGATVQALTESGRSVGGYAMIQGDTPLNPVTRTAGYNERKHFGVPGDATSAEKGYNPTKQAYYIVWVGDYGAGQTEDAAKVYARVTIDYTVKFTKRIDAIDN